MQTTWRLIYRKAESDICFALLDKVKCVYVYSVPTYNLLYTFILETQFGRHRGSANAAYFNWTEFIFQMLVSISFKLPQCIIRII